MSHQVGLFLKEHTQNRNRLSYSTIHIFHLMFAPQNYVFLDLELNILQSRNSYFSIIIRPGKICIFFFQLESHCDMDCQKAPIACPFSKFGCRERVSYKCSFSFYTHFKSFQVKVIFSCHGPPSKYHFHFSNT